MPETMRNHASKDKTCPTSGTQGHKVQSLSRIARTHTYVAEAQLGSAL